MKKIFKWYLLEEEDIKNIVGRGNKHEAMLQRLEKRGDNIEAFLLNNTHCPRWAEEVTGTRELSLEEWQEIDRMVQVKPERPKGEWIFNPTDAIDLMFTKPKCNKCGFESADGGNFCSNCGADMKGEE